MIHLTDKTREQLDGGSFACEIFVGLQIAFDTVDHDIFIQKLNHFGTEREASNWFLPCLPNRLQYVHINSFNTNLNFEHIPCGVPQGSILGPPHGFDFILVIYTAQLDSAQFILQATQVF